MSIDKTIITDYWKRNLSHKSHEGVEGDGEEYNKILKECYFLLFHLYNHTTTNELQRKILIKCLKYLKNNSTTYIKLFISNRLDQILMKHILTKDEIYQNYGTAILGNLACYENNSENMIQTISFPILLQLFHSGSSMTQENIAGLFGNLASNNENRLIIYQNHVIPSLLHGLYHSSAPNVHEAILWALSNLATVPVIITNLYGYGCIAKIIDLMTSTSATKEFVSYALSLVGRISRYPTLRDTICTEKVARALFSLFEVLAAQLSSLNQKTVLTSTTLLTSCCHAAEIVGNISWSYSVRLLVNKEDNIHIIKDLTDVMFLRRFLICNTQEFSPFNDLTTILLLTGIEHATQALANLAMSDFLREPIRHTGVLPSVIKLLGLNKIAQTYTDITDPILKRCESIVESSVNIICNLSKSYAFMHTILELGGVEALIQVLTPNCQLKVFPPRTSEDEFHHITEEEYYSLNGARECAVEALSHLAYTDTIRVVIWESGIVSFLCDLISASIFPSVQSEFNPPQSSSPAIQSAIVTLSNLSFCSSLRRPLLSLKVLDIMINILIQPRTPEKWKEYAALFVANVSSLHEAKEQIFQPHVITALHSLLKHCDEVNTCAAINKAIGSVPSSPILVTPFISTYAEWRFWIYNALRLYL